jgi:hypothetical protein
MSEAHVARCDLRTGQFGTCPLPPRSSLPPAIHLCRLSLSSSLKRPLTPDHTNLPAYRPSCDTCTLGSGGTRRVQAHPREESHVPYSVANCITNQTPPAQRLPPAVTATVLARFLSLIVGCRTAPWAALELPNGPPAAESVRGGVHATVLSPPWRDVNRVYTLSPLTDLATVVFLIIPAPGRQVYTYKYVFFPRSCVTSIRRQDKDGLGTRAERILQPLANTGVAHTTCGGGPMAACPAMICPVRRSMFPPSEHLFIAGGIPPC